MITNILLTVILISIITSFVILSNKLFDIKQRLVQIISILSNENHITFETLDSFKSLVERFHKHSSFSEDFFNIIRNLIRDRFKDLDNVTDNIYDRLNTLDTDITKLIIDEHEATRKEVAKRAKLSSKIKSKSKQSKSINK